MWNKYPDVTVETGKLWLLVRPKRDYEAHMLEVPVIARKDKQDIYSYQMERSDGQLYYLNYAIDYQICFWKKRV
jgi:hypothetical protein